MKLNISTTPHSLHTNILKLNRFLFEIFCRIDGDIYGLFGSDGRFASLSKWYCMLRIQWICLLFFLSLWCNHQFHVCVLIPFIASQWICVSFAVLTQIVIFEQYAIKFVKVSRNFQFNLKWEYVCTLKSTNHFQVPSFI